LGVSDRTASTREAEAAVAFLRDQGCAAQPDAESSDVVVLEQNSVEAVELLLPRAPPARPLP